MPTTRRPRHWALSLRLSCSPAPRPPDKTALARSIVRTLVGDPAIDVPSPSFALVQPYEASGAPLLHADLYRLRSEREIDELGLFDRTDAIVLVEWPERAPELMQLATMQVALSVPADGIGRVAEITR